MIRGVSRIAVVGHVEWVDFLAVGQLPHEGEIVAARRVATHGGGSAIVAAAVLAELGAEVDFYGAFGSDANGDAVVADLTERGIAVHSARRPGPTRQVITLLDARGQRSIITIGDRQQPEGADELGWERLATADGVYFTAGDHDALLHARQAKVLVATPRISERLQDPDVQLDALIYSADDEHEHAWVEPLKPYTRLLVVTDGAHGGHWSGQSEGSWEPVVPTGPVIDSYGAGDSFAAGFTYGLATTGDPAAAAAIGARCGALILTRPGAP
jgi:ribokinase